MNEEKTTNELVIISEENIKDMIYEIRGQKVMLDFDLARIYGYETRYFNRQIKNNIEKFPEDFMFQITREELMLLVKCKNFTSRNSIYFAGQNGGTRKLPYAFTEKGIYMLMTVLRGELAIQQSITLIRLFQEMKDYLIKANNLITANETLKLARQVNENTLAIEELKETIEPVIKCFDETTTFNDHFLIQNGQRIEADIAYQQIYSSANRSIIIIDDYISIKTLEHLKVCSKHISITICSDNVARTPLTENEINDFIEDTGINITLKPTGNRIHDRYIVIDHKANNECFYHSGSSSKDSGKKMTAITKIEYPSGYYQIIDELLN